MAKVKEIYKETFKKGTDINTGEVLNLIEQNFLTMKTEIVNRGKQSDDSEFITVKLIIEKKL